MLLLLNFLAGMLTCTFATHRTHQVQPDDKLCVQLPCPTLQNIVDHSKFYFKSYTTLVFVEGEYYHVQTDLNITNVNNFSLIGAPNASDVSTPLSIIRCLPNHHIHFYNVANLVIKNLKFQGCGSMLPKLAGTAYTSSYEHLFWTSLFFYRCNNVEAVNVYFYSPVGYGIIGINVMANNSLENVTIVIDRERPLGYTLFACSYGVYWSYGGGVDTSYETVFLYIINIKLIQKDYESGSGLCIKTQRDLFNIEMHQFSVHVIVRNTNFYKLRGSLFKLTVTSLSQNSIGFYNCNFTYNTVSYYAVDVHYWVLPLVSSKYSRKVDITFAAAKFSFNTYGSVYPLNDSILQFVASSSSLQTNLNVVFTDVLFNGNEVTLLNVLSTTPLLVNQPIIRLVTTGYFIVKDNRNFIYDNFLISIMKGQLHFNGVTKFIGNQKTEILHIFSSLLQFSNNTEFIRNNCKYVIFLNGHSVMWCCSGLPM